MSFLLSHFEFQMYKTRRPMQIVRSRFMTSLFFSSSSSASTSTSAVFNRLHKEKSPYLKQHETNPVNWYPWSEEAFSVARSRNKPIFLSIGYSTCHWCHVMAHESFENNEIAKIMNENFVNIKIDREERPDVDRQYMLFVQVTTGSGGWPLSLFLTPSLKPFYGGTYFPPAVFTQLLHNVSSRWRMNQRSLEETSDRIVSTLADLVTAKPSDKDPSLSFRPLLYCYSSLAKSFDSQYGGFGKAPKFPTPPLLDFLISYQSLCSLLNEKEIASNTTFYPTPAIEVIDHCTTYQKSCDNALEMLSFTLRKMAAGGIYDQVGKGFHRYSVDKYFHVPHFEKMLYDQAQLMSIYSRAYAATKDEKFKEIAVAIFDYCKKKLATDAGGFMAAQDADSLPTESSSRKSEGAFYVWTYDEIQNALKDDKNAADMLCWVYGIEKDGNVRTESDAHGELAGKNVFYCKYNWAEAGLHFSQMAHEVKEKVKKLLRKLYEIRERRPHPSTDHKVITAWNGLMLTGLCDLWKANECQYVWNAAIGIATFIMEQMYDPSAGGLKRIWSEGSASNSIPSCSEDYAFVIQGFLSLYQITGNNQYAIFAITLQEEMDRKFWDKESFGYSTADTSHSQDRVLFNMKDDNDGAEPAVNSAAFRNLITLQNITSKQIYKSRLHDMLKLYWQKMEDSPSSLPSMLAALTWHLYSPLHFVINRGSDDRLYYELLGYIGRKLKERQFLIVVDKDISMINATLQPSDVTGVSVCDDKSCFVNTTSVSDLEKFFKDTEE